MNIAIVDDEDRERDRISDMIKSYAVEHSLIIRTDTYRSAEEILAVFRPYAFTAIFMDIYMEGKDGVDAAREILSLDPSAKVIFLTSSEERMPDAFSIHAYDYIAKPAEKGRIYKALNDVMMRVDTLKTVPIFSFISNIKHNR